MVQLLPIAGQTAPEGHKECPECQIWRPLAAFGRHKGMRDGLQFYCRECTRIRAAKFKEQNPDSLRRSQKKYYRKNKAACDARRKRLTAERRAALVAQFKSKPCMDCGESYPPYVMDFDHRPGTEKKFILAGSRIGRFGLEVIMDEIAKCDLVCANCHRLRTHKRRVEVRS